MVSVEIRQLEMEKNEVIRFFKKQIETFRNVKKEIEKVQWNDARYDELVNAMNQIGMALSQGIQILTNGNKVYIIDDLLPLVEEYKALARQFPKI
ncbi:MAG: hypothetical protein IKA02_00110 [Clostridia bacterium]|nr:hypothetical protein [Clostridia bacterium]